MLTGHTSTSFFASSRSAVASGSISTRMNMEGISAPPGGTQPADLLGGGVLLALDDGAGVAETHAGHGVHEAPGHEGDDGQAGAVLRDIGGELRLHGAARLGVDDDSLRLRVVLEERHQLGVG